jgi:hypothetical protein
VATVGDYVDLIEAVEELGLIDHVDTGNTRSGCLSRGFAVA